MKKTMNSGLLYQEIKEYLLEIIKDSKEGDILPSQTELTYKFKVNHMTVRKALEVLEEEGFIYRIQGKGTFARKRIKPSKICSILILLPSDWEENISLGLLVEGMVTATTNENIHISFYSLSKFYDFFEILSDRKFQGIIWALPEESEKRYLKDFFSKGYSVMVLNRMVKEPFLNYVSTDHHKGAFEIASHLLQMGHYKEGGLLVSRRS
ncbi:GntR family transcriptional regulator, partial [bacterium]|nr:GntR family transcriptional regulator [bacterium]